MLSPAKTSNPRLTVEQVYFFSAKPMHRQQVLLPENDLLNQVNLILHIRRRNKEQGEVGRLISYYHPFSYWS